MKFGEKLIEDGVINQAQLDAALSHQAQTGQRIGEALLELGYIGEVDLLRFLAKEFNTQYVSSQKLSKVAVAPELLEMVPVELAEKHLLFPVLIGPDKKSIGVVTFEPQESRGLEDLRIIAGVEEVSVYIAGRDAIRAAIKKHYRGDIHAFDVLDQESKAEIDQFMDQYTESMKIEIEPRPRQSGPVVEKESAEGEFREPTSSWTKSIEAVRGSSLVSDNDFLETLNILVGLLEVQASHLEGHSARVARAVKFISERMGLKETEVIHNITAAYLHDLGKRSHAHLTLLSIEDSADYKKRAKRYHLTPSRLFDSVHLPPPVNNILTHLYEAWDGSGLPEELLQDAIPQGSRIIAAVDAWADLVFNQKNFLKTRMSSDEAMEWIKKESGRLFDPAVVKLLEEYGQVEAAEADQPESGPLVLLADPEPADSSDLELKLAREGFRVRVARDSQSAGETLAEETVSAVITEMRLAPEDGFSLLEKIAQRGKALPVIMMASDPPPEAITRALDGGVFDFVTRPLVPEVLIAKLKKEIAKSRVVQEDDDTAPVENLSRPRRGPEDVILTEPPPPDPGEDETEDLPTATEIRVEVDDGVPSPEDEPLPGPRSDSFASVGGSKSRIFAGNLEGKYAYNLVRALVAKRRTGLLILRHGEQRGEIFFNQGYVFHAQVEGLSQEESFLKMAAWRDCLYRFEQDAQPHPRNMKTPTPMLLKIGDPDPD